MLDQHTINLLERLVIAEERKAIAEEKKIKQMEEMTKAIYHVARMVI